MQSYLFTVENVINHFLAKSYEDLEQLTQEEVFDYFKARLLAEKEAEEREDINKALEEYTREHLTPLWKHKQSLQNSIERLNYDIEEGQEIATNIYYDQDGWIKYMEPNDERSRKGMLAHYCSSLRRVEYTSPKDVKKALEKEVKRLEPLEPHLHYNPMNHF